MQCIYAVGTNCASVTYGNIAQHIKEYVKLFCPKDFFNYEYISSEIAYRNIRRQLGANTRRHLAKRQKPFLVLRPIYTVPDEGYLFNIPLTTSVDHLESVVDMRNLFPIIQNTSEGLGLFYTLNRDKIDFQVTITTSTAFQQIDLYKSIVNVADWYRPHTVRFPLEFMIPRGIISAMASRQMMDLGKEEYAGGIFLDYLNMHSSYPITYKMRTSTSKDEYFLYSNQYVMITFTDLQIQEGTRKGMADDEYQLSFNVSAEFNIPGKFFLVGDDRFREKTMNSIIQAEMLSDGISFPLFTIENLFGGAMDVNGYRKLRSSILQIEKNSDGNDITDFSSLVGNDIKTVLKMYSANHNNIDTLAFIDLYQNSVRLERGKDFIVDWSKFKIITYNPSEEDTYRFVLYLNEIKVNEILVDLTDKQSQDRPRFKPK